MHKRTGYLSSFGWMVMLILALVVAGCASQSPPATPAAPAAPAAPGAAAPPAGNTVTIRNFAFSPAALSVKPGTTVTWTNQDSAPHTVVSADGDPAPFTSDTLATGASFTFTFTTPGTYTYHCSIHPSMTGTIVVQG